ncbi:hypothetical protein BDC45DRAFT_531459 [Circinella umbellata]|nr:hypothetical protein BDC45DRAFT_531459 [Circinella umbellata]
MESWVKEGAHVGDFLQSFDFDFLPKLSRERETWGNMNNEQFNNNFFLRILFNFSTQSMSYVFRLGYVLLREPGSALILRNFLTWIYSNIKENHIWRLICSLLNKVYVY